jgi:hypothetical protein
MPTDAVVVVVARVVVRLGSAEIVSIPSIDDKQKHLNLN